MALREEKVIFLIADISGYTDFMLANEKSLEHSHIIISELIQTVLDEVQLPLSLAKLEGDAVFLYAVKDEAFAARAEDLGARVLRFFNVFSNKVAELTEKHGLKVVVHSGRCAFYQIANLTELSGVDVIVVHRLLKNSVGLSEYVLLTEAAQQDLQLPLTLLSKGEETYEGIGVVPTYVYSPLFLETLRCEIKREYADVATNPAKGFHFHTGRMLAQLLGYSDELLEGIPESAISRLAGTGNPFALGPLNPGETVVELGCGAGMDTLIASRMVGPSGRVLSIDMTPEMLDEARAAASEAGATNIDLHLGYIENIPLPDASADVIISNGVINLAPDKKRVFREMHRVLKDDGRLQIGDIIVQKAVPESAKRNIDLWAGWIAGALLEAELIALLNECGFENVEVPWRADVFRGAPQDKSSATFGTLGVNFRARKAARREDQAQPAVVRSEATFA